MAKKGLIILVLAVVIAGVALAQEEHKHQPSDVLIGLNYGMGMTPNIGGVLGDPENISRGNYAIVFDFGLTADFYVFNWLSFNTGLLLHPDIYLLWDQDPEEEFDNFTDIAATPLCLTVPLAAHINIPKVEWLYAGIGLSLNFPVASLLDSVIDEDTKGKFFVGMPVDLGFDFIQPGRGGMRFFFRVTPEFHKHGTTVPIGFIWQIWNWKVYGKKNKVSEKENGYGTASTARADAKAEKPVKKAEAEKPADTKAASVSAERDNAKYRATLDAYNAARSKLEKAEANKIEAEARLVSAQEAVTLAEAELAKAAAALSALEGR
ncbi:MAG: hypothetical protein LBB89_01460 [Treponema sp.]|jgi:hypothetical protein|nr:hypothetical protein [Treponema sp.]